MPVIQNLDDLKKLRTVMDGKFSRLHLDQEQDERFYNLDFADDLHLPKQFTDDAVVLPTAREVVDNATDHITPLIRRIEVPRRNTEESGTKQAIKLKRFYEALLNWIERQSPISPFREAAKQLPAYGTLIGKFIHDETILGNEPEQLPDESEEDLKARRKEWNELRKLDMPYSLTIRNPINVTFDPFNDPPMWVMEITEKFVYEVERIYPKWPNAKNVRAHRTVEVIEYWEDEQRSVMINRESAFGEADLVPNEAGFHPYIIIGSGLGIDDSGNNLNRRYVSILRYIKSVLMSESRNYSMQDIVIKAGAWPIRIAEGERANEMPDIKLEYGTIQPLPPGVTIKDLTPQIPDTVIFSAISIANNIISSAASPRVLRGLPQAGISSGFDRQLALGEARLKFGPLEQGMNQFLTRICIMAGLYMERTIKHPVSVAAGAIQDDFFEIHSNTFNGHHAVKVTINVLEPEDEIRKRESAANLVNAGLMSPQTALAKFFPELDAKSELARIFAARVLFSPQMMNIISAASVQKVVETLELEGLLETIMAQQMAEDGGRERRNSVQESRQSAPSNPPPTAGDTSDQARQRQLDLRELG